MAALNAGRLRAEGSNWWSHKYIKLKTINSKILQRRISSMLGPDKRSITVSQRRLNLTEHYQHYLLNLSNSIQWSGVCQICVWHIPANDALRVIDSLHQQLKALLWTNICDCVFQNILLSTSWNHWQSEDTQCQTSLTGLVWDDGKKFNISRVQWLHNSEHVSQWGLMHRRNTFRT